MNVTAIAAGIGHTCALTDAGRVMCWGSNSYGRLGDGTQELRTAPVDLTVPVDVVATAAFETSSLAAGPRGTMAAYGGDDNFDSSATPSHSHTVNP
ncbi:MAG: hypothetical protein V3V97_08125 [Hyphomicrobiaceae bacterium]